MTSRRRVLLYAATAAAWSSLAIVAAQGFRQGVQGEHLLAVILIGTLTVALTVAVMIVTMVAPLIAAWRSGFASGLAEAGRLQSATTTDGASHLHAVDNA